jgi:enoyl-CoA hydratase
MIFQNIAVEINQQIATLTITRASKLNALNAETLAEIHQAIDELDKNTEVRGIILTGEGTKAFVAGADISQMVNMNAEEAQKYSKFGQDTFSKIENASKPVIALVNGFALGGGCEIAMACHIRIATENAKLGLPEVTLGVIPGFGGTQRLAQYVGKAKAIELMLTGNIISAQDALAFGLVSYVFPNIAEANAKAVEILEKVKNNAPIAIAHAIKAINALNPNDAKGYQIEHETFGILAETADFKEGMGAFLEKRKANFIGK